MRPDEARPFMEAHDAGTALYRDAVKQDDIRPPIPKRDAEPPMRDVTPDDRTTFPPGAPDDPGPEGEDFGFGDEDTRRKRGAC